MNEKQRIDAVMKEYGLYAKKSFGQNFLINEGIIRKIVESMNPEAYDHVIEIGPGLASLTLPLSKKAKDLVAVDADRDMVKVLTNLFKDSENVKIIQSDFLRFNPNEYSTAKDRIFIGNLPYNITSELLEYMLQKGFIAAGCMVQKEVADKLTYVPGKKDNNALGAFIKANGELSLVTFVDRSCFNPAPNVDSAFIRIDMHKKVPFTLYPVFKAFFKDPNKTISNCLRQFKQYQGGLEYLKENEPDALLLRARQMEANDLVALAKKVLKYSK
jgi:16S rRNA (adenine1518-N6/adenine1519-N6)-dimethyltransferase